MHISEGILNGTVCLAGYGLAGGVTLLSLSLVKEEEIPRISVVTAAVFIASLIHIKIGPASVHLLLNILAGILLGWGAFPSIVIALFFQALMFGHGGISTLGVNALIIGLPPLVAHQIFRAIRLLSRKWLTLAAVFFIGALGTGGTIFLGALALVFSQQEFWVTAQLLFVANIPVMVLEGVICTLVVAFLMKIKPGLLENVR